jgi:hypothetical protein
LTGEKIWKVFPKLFNSYRQPDDTMLDRKVYSVESISLGNISKENYIIFGTQKEMEEAYREIDNGKDIYVKCQNEIIMLLNKNVAPKIYDGTVLLKAKYQGD